MAKLVAIASFGKGTWAHLIKLCEVEEWEKIYIITDEFGINRFPKKENVEFIKVDFRTDFEEIKDKVLLALKGKIDDWDVGLNIMSGDGKSHMAVLSALLGLGLGIRLVYVEDDKLKEL
jgi:hypothetical protein